MAGEKEDGVVTTSADTTKEIDSGVESAQSAVVVPDSLKPEDPASSTTPEEGAGDGEVAAVTTENENLDKLEEVESSGILESEATKEDSAEGSKAQSNNLQEAISALCQGKRHFLVRNIPLAIASLGEACRIFSEEGGLFSTGSAEAHYYYGKALLEQSRLDLNVFENPPAPAAESKLDEEDDEDDEEEEMEECDDDDEEADSDDKVKDGEAELKSETEAGSSEAEVKGENGHSAMEEDLNLPSPKAKSTNVNVAETTVTDGELPSTSSGADADVTAPEEELSNLELAWEVLEVSKVCYKRLVEETQNQLCESEKTDLKPNEELAGTLKGFKNKLALVHSMLGEVATESEQYPQAVEEIETSLGILSEIEEFDNREIAQCHFQLGIAYSFDKKFQEAIQCFKTSSELIEKRIERLEKILAAKTESEVEEEATKAQLAEIADLKAALPELQEKINDTLDAEKDAVRVVEEEKQEKELIERSSPIKNPNPPIVNDISHLVKKKKRIEDLSEEPPAKKACTEPEASALPQQESNGGHEAAAVESANGSTQ
jgi:tetratricopeptide (TPR) repeat protein